MLQHWTCIFSAISKAQISNNRWIWMYFAFYYRWNIKCESSTIIHHSWYTHLVYWVWNSIEMIVFINCDFAHPFDQSTNQLLLHTLWPKWNDNRPKKKKTTIITKWFCFIESKSAQNQIAKMILNVLLE